LPKVAFYVLPAVVGLRRYLHVIAKLGGNGGCGAYAVGQTYRLCVVGALAAPLLLFPCAAWAADPEEKAPPAAWPTSPFLGAVDGVTGVPIPWLCRSGGSVYRLGDTVCMSTHLGVQMARCDLVLNNTSWVPIGVPCAMGSGR
jgi:hypothetical protein